MSDFLGSIGFGFLWGGTYYLAIIVAVVELIAGIMLLINYRVHYAYAALTGIIAVALLFAHIPSGNWMNIMIHVGLLWALAGMTLITYEKDS